MAAVIEHSVAACGEVSALCSFRERTYVMPAVKSFLGEFSAAWARASSADVTGRQQEHAEVIATMSGALLVVRGERQRR